MAVVPCHGDICFSCGGIYITYTSFELISQENSAAGGGSRQSGGRESHLRQAIGARRLMTGAPAFCTDVVGLRGEADSDELIPTSIVTVP